MLLCRVESQFVNTDYQGKIWAQCKKDYDVGSSLLLVTFKQKPEGDMFHVSERMSPPWKDRLFLNPPQVLTFYVPSGMWVIKMSTTKRLQYSETGHGCIPIKSCLHFFTLTCLLATY